MDQEKLKEVAKTQTAVEEAMQSVIDYIKATEEPTSEQAHAIIDKVLDSHGCISPEGHIVAGGDQAVDPHETGTGILKEGVPIVIDIYPKNLESGYYADMTRTICKGNPIDKAKNLYKDVLEAHNRAVSMLGSGVECSSIQNSVEEFFKEKGYKNKGVGREFPYEEGFVHGVGHGVSKILHDHPRIGRKTQDMLKIGDIVTIEPGLYYHGIGGVRIEDMYVITQSGSERITRFPHVFEI